MEDPWKEDLFCNLHFSNRASPVVIPGKAPQGIML
jgi:hypothetical protein